MSFIVGLSVSLYILTGSIFSIINDINVDLEKSNNVVGQVVYTDVREISNFSIRWTTYSRVFYFRLNNSDQKFAIQNSYEGYNDLQTNIKIDDTIKVYYRSTFLDDYNRHIFQIEKGDKILVAYKDYDKSVSAKAGIGLFIGIVFLIALIMWFTKFNLLKFMTSWVER